MLGWPLDVSGAVVVVVAVGLSALRVGTAGFVLGSVDPVPRVPSESEVYP